MGLAWRHLQHHRDACHHPGDARSHHAGPAPEADADTEELATATDVLRVDQS